MNDDPNSKSALTVQHASIVELIENHGEPSLDRLEADRAILETIIQWANDGESDLGDVIVIHE